MGNKQGIADGHDFSDEAEEEEQVPNLSDKTPIQVKKDVEKLMKDLKGSLHFGHFDKTQTVNTSNELLKYVRYTREYEDEIDISKKIYSGMSKAGISELVKALWDVKTKEKVNLDDPKKHAKFSKVFVHVVRIIEISTYESIKLCKVYLSENNLLELINADLNSSQFQSKVDKKPKESNIANCTKMYFSIMCHLLDNDDNLEQNVSDFINETLEAATVQKYKKAKSITIQMKVAKIMSRQNLNDDEFAELINMPLELAEGVVKQLYVSLQKGSKISKKGLSFWDLISYVEFLLGYKGKACKNLMNAGFLTFARDMLLLKYVQKNENENEEKNTLVEAYELDEAYVQSILKCVKAVSYFKAGCYGIVSKDYLFQLLQDIAGGEVQNALEQSNQPASDEQDTGGDTTEAENDQIAEAENEQIAEAENEQIAEEDSAEMIAAECVCVVHIRLKHNPTLLKAIHLGYEQHISRKHVMISYSWSAEKEAVVKIAEAISGVGIEVWRDEDRLKPGTNLQRAMLEAIEGAVLVVVFYSSYYHRSQNCLFEYSQTEELRRPIFPILVDINEEGDEKEHKKYDEWLNKELKKGTERIYCKTSDADDEEKLNQLVEGVKEMFNEEEKKVQSDFEDLAPEDWNRTQVDAWLEKKKLHDLIKLNLDGKALQALAKKAHISGDDEADDKALDELNNELVNNKVDSRLILRFVSALRQL